MRVFSVIMAIITALVLGVAGYAVLTTQVGVEVVAVRGVPASEEYEAFEMARSWAQDSNTSTITRYSQDVIGDVSNYYIVYLDVAISNWEFLPAEWLQVSVRPIAGDVLQIRQDGVSIPGMTTQPVQAVLVTTNSNYLATRDVDVEYYIFGRRFTATTVAPEQTN